MIIGGDKLTLFADCAGTLARRAVFSSDRARYVTLYSITFCKMSRQLWKYYNGLDLVHHILNNNEEVSSKADGENSLAY